MIMEYKVAVLLPCYNEEKTIGKVVRDFREVLPSVDIYVYNNNSTDRTVEEATAAGAIVRHEYTQGKGNVIRRMFREVEADCYLMADGDDTYPAHHAINSGYVIFFSYLCSRFYEGVIGDKGRE